MQLAVKAELTYRFAWPCEVLLLIEAARTADQLVSSETLSISPDIVISRLDDPLTGERRSAFTAQDDVTISYAATVELLERQIEIGHLEASAIHDLPSDAIRFLRPSRYCPSDRFEAFARQQFGQLDGGAKVSAIIDWISTNLVYQIGVSDAWTTALDTFVGRSGVCRDFTHLAITLCRACDIPARAVSAYAWKLDPPDMHAVLEVYLGGGWHLIDATRMAPEAGLVRVATGLDAADIAFMTIFGWADLIAQSFEALPISSAP